MLDEECLLKSWPAVDISIITDLEQAKIQPLPHPADTILSAHRNYEDECERGQVDTHAACAHVPQCTALMLKSGQHLNIQFG